MRTKGLNHTFPVKAGMIITGIDSEEQVAQMTETVKDNQDTGTEGADSGDIQVITDEQRGEPAPRTTSDKFREASYVLLFIAAVFVVNAMETGSYRTPWPVAIITILAGLGLLGYSWYLRSRAE